MKIKEGWRGVMDKFYKSIEGKGKDVTLVPYNLIS
jgi:hypothetical protein